MSIERIMIGGRRYGKTTKIIEWVKQRPTNQCVIFCLNRDNCMISKELIDDIVVKITTPLSDYSGLLKGGTKYIFFDEFDLMDMRRLCWKDLVNHYLIITSSINNFFLSPILRLATLYPDKTTLFPFPHDRIFKSDFDLIAEEWGKDIFERDFLCSSIPPYKPFTLKEIMKKYNNPFGDKQ